MQTLEEAVAYAEQHLDSSKELFILAIHGVGNMTEERINIKIQVMQVLVLDPI